MVRSILTLSLCLLMSSGCGSHDGANKAEASVAPGANDRYATSDGRAAAIQILEGEGREKYQKPVEIVQNMALKEGDVICEVGAGSGYFTPYLSRAVGSTGTVYAEDPQAEFLEVLEQKKQPRACATSRSCSVHTPILIYRTAAAT
jgi:predicted methyltransferase